MNDSLISVVPIEVIQDRRLTLEQTRVLIALFSFRNKVTNTVWPSRTAIAERTEISFEVSPDEVAVLDGYCSAKNIKRTTVFRQLLRDWSAEQLHVATLILRVAGNKPDAPGQSRSHSE